MRHFFSCSEHALVVAHDTAWLKNVLVRVIPSAWSSTLCGCPFLDSLFFTLFLSVCFSCPFFFYLNLELNLFLHVVVIGAKKTTGTSPTEESGPLAENTSLTERERKRSMKGETTHDQTRGDMWMSALL